MPFKKLKSGWSTDSGDFVLRLAFFYGAIFLLVGSSMPYLPLWLDWRGLTETEIGLIFATPLIVRILFTPVISFAADKFGDRRLILIILAWGTFTSLLTFYWARSFLEIFAVHMFFALFWTTIMPLTETVAMTGVRDAGLDYGRMRLWGSLTFILASFGGGFVAQIWGAPSILWMLTGSAVILIIAAHLLPHPAGKGRLKAATLLPRIRIADALTLARSPLFLCFLIATSMVQAGHAVYYTFGTLHWQSLGISTSIIGALWAVGVIAEIILFAFSGRVVAHFGALQLILIAGVAATLRWSFTAFDPPLALLFPLQILHGLTFGAAHLGAIHFISEAVPEDYSATAQGLYAAITAGLIMGLAMAASGPLYKTFAGNAYLVMALLGVVSIGIALVLRKWDRRSLTSVSGY